MQIKIFTLRFSTSLGGFDDEPARDFMADKEVISVQEHFFVKDHTPYLTLVVKYVYFSAAHAAAPGKDKSKKEEYRHLLNEQNTPLFNQLREWRNEHAKKIGKPPFIIFNNRHLAEVASKMPSTLDQLSAVRGIGNAKIKQFGKAVLEIVALHAKKQTETGEKQPDNEPKIKKHPSGEKTKMVNGSLFEEKEKQGEMKQHES